LIHIVSLARREQERRKASTFQLQISEIVLPTPWQHPFTGTSRSWRGSLCSFESHPTVPGIRESLFAFVVLDRLKKDHQIPRRFVRSPICRL
jgi:hypothetical protein